MKFLILTNDGRPLIIVENDSLEEATERIANSDLKIEEYIGE